MTNLSRARSIHVLSARVAAIRKIKGAARLAAYGTWLPVGAGTAKQPFSDSPFFSATAFGELWELRLSSQERTFNAA